MSQEETITNDNRNENADSSPENFRDDETALKLPEQSEIADNLPIESIGSYGRIEPLMNEETENPEEGDIER